jgi:hypothetical protein
MEQQLKLKQRWEAAQLHVEWGTIVGVTKLDNLLSARLPDTIYI